MKTEYIITADNIDQIEGYSKIAIFPYYNRSTYATNNNVILLIINYIGAYGSYGEQFIFSVVKQSDTNLKINCLNYTTKLKNINNILAYYTDDDNNINLYVKSYRENVSLAAKVIAIELSYPVCKWINGSPFEDISDKNPIYSNNNILNENTLDLKYNYTLFQGTTRYLNQLLCSVHVSFENGTATKDMTNIIGNLTYLQKVVATINNDTNTNCIITSATLKNSTLMLKAYNNYTGSLDVNLIIYTD